MSIARWHAELAWLPHGVARDVLISADGTCFQEVVPEVTEPPPDAVRLPGLTLPGLANAHSHAFHRALRGVTQGVRGTFWTWRQQMYAVAARLDPDSYRVLARAVYAEMALAGITCVGEFHYLHHDRAGRPYAQANVMGEALLDAAAEAGIRITLLDACYLTGGIGRPLEGVQHRFGDGDAEGWIRRVEGFCADEHGALPGRPHARLGAAIHSVRAVPLDQMHDVVALARHCGAPLHIHVSEQRAENAACREAYGKTPVQVLFEADVLGPRTTAVHATHLAGDDVDLLGGLRSFVCMCPTTERDLADGIGPARRLADRGACLTLGSDSHAVVDLFEEARALEYHERVVTEERGHFRATELMRAATYSGHTSLGWPDAGEIVPGALADLVTVGFDTPRLAGARAETALDSVVFAGGAADVHHVVVSGRTIVRDGRHALIDDVPGALAAAVARVLPT